MKKLLGVLAVVMLAGVVSAPAAEARCWWNGYRTVCKHYRPYVRPVPPPYAYYPYRPYRHHRPYYRPPVYACLPPYCW